MDNYLWPYWLNSEAYNFGFWGTDESYNRLMTWLQCILSVNLDKSGYFVYFYGFQFFGYISLFKKFKSHSEFEICSLFFPRPQSHLPRGHFQGQILKNLNISNKKNQLTPIIRSPNLSPARSAGESVSSDFTYVPRGRSKPRWDISV